MMFPASFVFAFVTIILQMTFTSAGSSHIIARASSGIEGSMESYTTDFNRHLSLDENKKKVLLQDNLPTTHERNLDHEFKFEPKPNYKSYQPKSSMTKGQKIGLLSMCMLTVALAIYSCALRYELSTMNVYSLLNLQTITEEDDEEKVGDAYGRRFEMI